MSPRKSTLQTTPADEAVSHEVVAVPRTVPTTASDAPLYVANLGVRWRDLDAFNHVNNANYLTYLEEARLQWLQHVRDWFSETSMPVLAASTLNYRESIAWPASLHIELRCERLGNSSMTLAHRIVDADDTSRLYCDGHVVLVWMNPATSKPVSLPDAIREAANGRRDD
ncbi:MAG TPA: thioesterase family protein [Rhodanobacter sp.]|jgi:acyl-CoA thioester hydrolase